MGNLDLELRASATFGMGGKGGNSSMRANQTSQVQVGVRLRGLERKER